MNKQEQREYLKSLRRAMSSEAIAEKSAEIAKKLTALPEFMAANTVFIYISLPKEVATSGIIAECMRLGKTVLVPVTAGGRISLCLLEDTKELEAGEFGICEPKNPKLWQGEADIAVMPGLGFDRSGNRMGFGKGCYDRFLAENTCKKVGLVFVELLQECIETDTYDIPMDIVITEKEVIYCR